MDERIRLLSALDIFQGYEDGNFKLENDISRKEFVAIICRVLGLGDVAEGITQTSFIDVPSGDWASGSIKMATELGLIEGYGDSKFGPDDGVTYQQAVKILVSALGYNFHAQEKGGYPIGYLAVAAQNGITKNTENTMELPVNRDVIASIIYNSLEVDLMEQFGYGANAKYSVANGKTLFIYNICGRLSQYP